VVVRKSRLTGYNPFYFPFCALILTKQVKLFGSYGEEKNLANVGNRNLAAQPEARHYTD
jgi:hypothetical protein